MGMECFLSIRKNADRENPNSSQIRPEYIPRNRGPSNQGNDQFPEENAQRWKVQSQAPLFRLNVFDLFAATKAHFGEEQSHRYSGTRRLLKGDSLEENRKSHLLDHRTSNDDQLELCLDAGTFFLCRRSHSRLLHVFHADARNPPRVHLYHCQTPPFKLDA